jgi:hypothetical protein
MAVIVDFGLPGPDRGEGSRFLLVPPGYVDPVDPSRPMMRK